MAASDAGITIATATTKGDRTVNQDAVIARRMDPDTSIWGLRGVIGVADGMGGHAAGEVASKIAADTVEDVLGLSGDDEGRLATRMEGMDIDEALATTVRLANERIYRQGTANTGQQDMGTTLTVVGIGADSAHIAHLGDTRGYLLDEDGIHQVTQDHSWVARQVRENRMTENEAARSPMRSQLTRTLGVPETVNPDMLAIPLQPRSMYLVCSDGVTEVLAAGEISEIIRGADTLQQGCDRVISEVGERGASDNATVACIEIGKLQRGAVAGDADTGETTEEMYPAFEVRSRAKAEPKIRRMWPILVAAAAVVILIAVLTLRSCMVAPGQEARQATETPDEPPERIAPLDVAPLSEGLQVKLAVKHGSLVVVTNRHLTTTIHPPGTSDAEPAVRIGPESWYERELSEDLVEKWKDETVEITLWNEDGDMRIRTSPSDLDVYINQYMTPDRIIAPSELDEVPARIGFYFPANDKENGYTVALTSINPADLPTREEEASQ